jgi:hypothetical protein
MGPDVSATGRKPQTARLTRLMDRELVAARLLEASAKLSYDPDTDLDWEAPWAPGLWFIPEYLVSLYDTPLWHRLTPEQRIELSRHELGSLAGMGVWFETILLQLLARHIYDRDPTSNHVRYALTEIADECRHSMMFARLIEKLGTPSYTPPAPWIHSGARFLKTTVPTPGAFTGVLLVEEILDKSQRVTFPDRTVQPLVRDITRIHVVEEARHIRYAREELRRQMAHCPGWLQAYTRHTTAAAAFVVAAGLINPKVYAAVGLDPRQAVLAVRRSPHRRAVMQWAASGLVSFFGELGLMRGRSSMRLWEKSGFVPDGRPAAFAAQGTPRRSGDPLEPLG